MIRRARLSDTSSLAEIHSQELEGEFLVRLGKKFLESLYRDFLSQKQTIIFLKEDGKVQGFIMGVTDFSSLFGTIIKSQLPYYARLLIPRFLLSPRLAIEAVNTLLYPLLEGKNVPKAELVVIAVRRKYQRKKIGTQLLARLENELSKQNTSAYKVSCTKSNIKANNFYRKHSFVLTRRFTLYWKKWNMYIKNL